MCVCVSRRELTTRACTRMCAAVAMESTRMARSFDGADVCHFRLVCWCASSPTPVLQHTRSDPMAGCVRVPVSDRQWRRRRRGTACHMPHGRRVLLTTACPFPCHPSFAPAHARPSLFGSVPTCIGVHISQVHAPPPCCGARRWWFGLDPKRVAGARHLGVARGVVRGPRLAAGAGPVGKEKGAEVVAVWSWTA